VRTIGTQCYEDDDLAFLQQQELERQYEQQQQIKQAQTFTPIHPDLQTDIEELPTQPANPCDKEMSCSDYLTYAHEVSAYPLLVAHKFLFLFF
jgi:hypothetical protein